MAEAFDATIAVATSSLGLYLVIGARGMPLSPVLSAGGEVAVCLEERQSLLAILTADAHLAVQRHPDVLLAGPVTIDPDRFARFAALAGLDHGPTPPAELAD